MDSRYESLLDLVQRPARYIGGEINSITKAWDSTAFRMALVFPDTYEIGMSHIGFKILYHLINSMPDMLCERSFAPWPDMEALLRKKALPLVTLENNKPLKEFDVVGFSLSHELNYTNVLLALSLSGIPLRRRDRDSLQPIVIAGGTCCVNPEPMSEFIDAFLIGDGEEALIEIAESVAAAKKIGRKEAIESLSAIKGVYVPSLYEARYGENGSSGIAPLTAKAPAKIDRRAVSDIENCFYPTKQLVPFIPVVHDRLTLEIMRGCPHRCRFCQAAAVYSPLRIRSRPALMRLAKEAIGKTGYDEISLLSLSTGDYPGIKGLLEELVGEFKAKGVSVSLPSLRIESGIKDLPFFISQIKKTGFTFAPEVGSPALRNFVNKHIDCGKLLEAGRRACELGWQKIKLYFMMGFCRENGADLDAMLDIAHSIAGIRTDAKKYIRSVNVSISTFVPKPHTPLQWEGMESAERLQEKIGYLRSRVKSKKIRLNIHDIRMSILECCLSRGDRRTADAIEKAFLAGCRFDSWSDFFNFSVWENAFRESGLAIEDYTKAMGLDEPLAWDHINAGAGKKALADENITAHNQMEGIS